MDNIHILCSNCISFEHGGGMKTVLGLGLGTLLALSSQAYAQNSSAPVVVMTNQLVALEKQGATRSAPQWNNLLNRYKFIEATPLSDIRPAPGLERYKITHTMYGAEDEVFPSVFVVYKDNAIVAFLGLENQKNEATTVTDGYPIVYTQEGKRLSAQEKTQFETWFYTWLNSVN